MSEENLSGAPADNTRYKRASGKPKQNGGVSGSVKRVNKDKSQGSFVSAKKNELISLWCKNTPQLKQVYKESLITSDNSICEDESEIVVVNSNSALAPALNPRKLQFASDADKRKGNKKEEEQDGATSMWDNIESSEGHNTSAANMNSQRHQEHDDDSQSLCDQSEQHTSIQEEDLESDRKEQEEIINGYKQRLKERDNTVFFDLFELMIEKMTMVQESLHELKKQQSQVSGEVKVIEDRLSKMSTKYDNLTRDTREVGATNLKVVQAIIRNEQEIGSVKENVEKCEAWLYKGMITINGVDESEDEDTKQVVFDFLRDKLKIEFDIKVVFAFRMGNNKRRTILFKLFDPSDSRLIYSNVSKLKDQSNSDGEKYYVRDYTTEQVADQRMRIKDIMTENRRMPALHHMQMEIKRSELYINGEKYEKEIVPPSVKDYLLISKAQEAELNEITVLRGGAEQKDGSTFQSYIVKTETLDEVKVAYDRLKCDHASATHIMCGFRVFGIKHHIYQDYADDGEIGGGRRILAELKAAGAFNVAVFVVCYKSGKNLGPVRFQIITDLTKVAIKRIPECLNLGQYLQQPDRSLVDDLNKAAIRQRRERTRGYVNRGRGRRSVHAGYNEVVRRPVRDQQYHTGQDETDSVD